MPTDKYSIEELGRLAKDAGDYTDLDDSTAGARVLETDPAYWQHVADDYKPDPGEQMTLEEFGNLVKGQDEAYKDFDAVTTAQKVLEADPAYWRVVVEKKKGIGGGNSSEQSTGHWSDSAPTPRKPKLPNNPLNVIGGEFRTPTQQDPNPQPVAKEETKPAIPWALGPTSTSSAISMKKEGQKKAKEKQEAYLESPEYKEHVEKIRATVDPVLSKYQENLDKGLLPSGRPMESTDPKFKYIPVMPGGALTLGNSTPAERKDKRSKEYAYQFVDMVMNNDPDLKNLDDDERYEVRMALNERVRTNERRKELDAIIKQTAKESGVELDGKGMPSVVSAIGEKIEALNARTQEFNSLASGAASEMQKQLASEHRVTSEGLKLLEQQLAEAVSSGNLSPEEASTQFESAFKEQQSNFNRRVREQEAEFIQMYDRLYNEKTAALKQEIDSLGLKAKESGIDYDPETGKLNVDAFYNKLITRAQTKQGASLNAKTMREWASYSGEEKARLILSSGVGDMIHTVAGGYLTNQYYQTGETLRRMGEKMQFDQIPDTGEFSAKSLLDPMWWQTKGLRMLPFTLALMGPSMAAGIAVKGGLMSLGVSAEVAATSGALGAVMVSRPLESLMEGGGAYLDVINNGGSVAEAEKQFSYVNARNYALAASDFLQFLPILRGGVKGWKRAAAVIGGAGLEGGEEIYQEWINKKAGDRDYDLLEFAKSPAGAEVLALGALNGFAFEMIGTGFTKADKAASQRKEADLMAKLMRQQVNTMLATGEGVVQRKTQLANTLQVQLHSGIINKEDYEAAMSTLDEVTKAIDIAPSSLDDSGRSQYIEALHELKTINQKIADATPETEEILKKRKSDIMSHIDKVTKGTAEGYFIDNVSYSKEDFLSLFSNPEFIALANMEGHTVEVRNDKETLNLFNEVRQKYQKDIAGSTEEVQTQVSKEEIKQQEKEQLEIEKAKANGETIEEKPVKESKPKPFMLSNESQESLAKVNNNNSLPLEEALPLFTELKAQQNEADNELVRSNLEKVGSMLKGYGMTDTQLELISPKPEPKAKATSKKKEESVAITKPVSEKRAEVKKKRAEVKRVQQEEVQLEEQQPEAKPEVIAEKEKKVAAKKAEKVKAEQELEKAEKEHDEALEAEDVAPVTDQEKPAPKIETRKQLRKALGKIGLSKEQAEYSSAVIDRMATAWARRNKSTKEAYYDKLSIQKQQKHDPSQKAQVLFQLKPPKGRNYIEVTPEAGDEALVQAEVDHVINTAKHHGDAIIPSPRVDKKTGKYVYKVYMNKKTGERVVAVDPGDIDYSLKKAAKEYIAKDEKAAIKKLADKIYKDLQNHLKRPEIMEAIGWYSNHAKWAQKNFGAMTEMFSQLLGATSPGTTVRENWKTTVEAIENYSTGMYDKLLQEYHAHVQNVMSMSREELDTRWDIKHKNAKKPTKLTDGKVDGFRIQLINEFKKVPLKRNGTKFNKNSRLVLKALYGNYLSTIKSVKIQDYAGNLAGRTDNPVMDMWASRYMRRMIHEGTGVKRWRILPMNESALSTTRNATGNVTGDYPFSQEVFKEVAKRTPYKAADLQTILWYIEKDYWLQSKMATKEYSIAGEAFDKYYNEMNLERYQAGFSTTRDGYTDPQEQENAKERIKQALRSIEGIKSIRVEHSYGRSKGINENTIDIEFTVEAGTNVQPIYDLIEKMRVEYGQKDAFVSKVIDININENRENPNLRPIIEVNLKEFNNKDAIELTDMLADRGIDGFTFSRSSRGEILGFRAQFIPENLPVGADVEAAEQLWLDNVLNIREELVNTDRVAHATLNFVDTKIFSNEQTIRKDNEQSSKGMASTRAGGGYVQGGTDRSEVGREQGGRFQSRILAKLELNIHQTVMTISKKAPEVEEAAEKIHGKKLSELSSAEASSRDFIRYILDNTSKDLSNWLNMLESTVSTKIGVETGELYQSPMDEVFDAVEEAVATGAPLASIRFENGKSIMTFFEGANITSVFHELGGHFTFEEILMGLNSMDKEIRDRSAKELNVIVDAYNKNNPDEKVDAKNVFTDRDTYVAVHEFFANGFVNAMIKFGEQKVDSALNEIFKRFAKWVKDLFDGLKGEGIMLTPELEALYREVLNFETQQQEELNDLNISTIPIQEALEDLQVPITHAKTISKISEYLMSKTLDTSAWMRKHYEAFVNAYVPKFTLSSLSDKETRKLINQVRFIVSINKDGSIFDPFARSIMELSKAGNASAKAFMDNVVQQFNEGKRKGIPKEEAVDLMNPEHVEVIIDFMHDLAMDAFNRRPLLAAAKRESVFHSFTSRDWNKVIVPADMHALLDDIIIFGNEALDLAQASGITIPEVKVRMLGAIGIKMQPKVTNPRAGLLTNAVKDEFGRIAVSMKSKALGIIKGEEIFYYEDGEVYPVKDPLKFIDKAQKIIDEIEISRKKKFYIRIYSTNPKLRQSLPRLAAGLFNKMGIEFQEKEGTKGFFLDMRGDRTTLERAMMVVQQLLGDTITVYRHGEQRGLFNVFNMVVQEEGVKALSDENGKLHMFEPPLSSVPIKGKTLFQTRQYTDEEVRELNENALKEMQAKVEQLKANRKLTRNLDSRIGTGMFDRQYSLKKLLWNTEGTDKEKAAKVVQAVNRVRRANPMASHQLANAFKRVLGDVMSKTKLLSSKEREVLSRLVTMRRVVELDRVYDETGRPRLNHTIVGMNDGSVMSVNKEVAEHWIDLLRKGDEGILSAYNLPKDTNVNNLFKAADEYSKVMREQLDQLYESKIISKNAYDKFIREGQHYSPRLFVSHLEEAIQTGRAASSKTGIHVLNEGHTGLMHEDIQHFLAIRIRDTQQAIVNAKLGRSMRDFLLTNKVPWGYIPAYSKEFLEAMVKEQQKVVDALAIGEVYTPKFRVPTWQDPVDGFRQVTFVSEGGRREAFHLLNDVADQYEGNRFETPDWVMNTMELAGIVSLTKLLKASATGYNPEFLVRNIPLDILHIQMTSDIYGRSVLYGTAKMVKDMFVPRMGRDGKMHTIIGQVMARTGAVEDYYRTGGFHMSLTNDGQGSWDDKNTNWTKRSRSWDAFKDFAGYLGQSSELLTRITLRDKYLREKLKEYADKGRALSEQEREQLEIDATEYAIAYLDFSQGGIVVKELDKVLPYLNAATQVSYGTLRAMKRNPVGTSRKILELGIVSALLTAWNSGAYLQLFGDDDDDEDSKAHRARAMERAKYFDEQISARVKASNWIIMTNMKFNDHDNQPHYLYFKIPKDVSIQFFTGMVEGAALASYKGDMDYLYNKQRAEEIKSLASMFGDLSLAPPIIKAVNNYTSNYDHFWNNDIWTGRDVQPWAEYKIGTPEFYKVLGKLFAMPNDNGELEGGMSPVRLQNAFQQVMSKNNTFFTLFERGLNLTMGGKPVPLPAQDEFYQNLSKFYFARRAIGVTDFIDDRSMIENFTLNANTTIQMIDNEILIFQRELSDGMFNEDDIDPFIEHMAEKLLPDTLPDYAYPVNKAEFDRVTKKAIRRALSNDTKRRVDYKVFLAVYYDDTPRAEYFYTLLKNAESQEQRESLIETAFEIEGFFTDGVKRRLMYLEGKHGTTYLD